MRNVSGNKNDLTLTELKSHIAENAVQQGDDQLGEEWQEGLGHLLKQGRLLLRPRRRGLQGQGACQPGT